MIDTTEQTIREAQARGATVAAFYSTNGAQVDTLPMDALLALVADAARLRAALVELVECAALAEEAWDTPSDSYREGIFGHKANARAALERAAAEGRAALEGETP